jgi:hypothetical protein
MRVMEIQKNRERGISMHDVNAHAGVLFATLRARRALSHQESLSFPIGPKMIGLVWFIMNER